MGSLQQISLGVICLVAAFLFGSYVNNNPPLNEPPYAQTQPDADTAPPAGNVHSHLSEDLLASVEKRPSPIGSLRNSIQPKFRLESPSVSARANSVTQTLPPPSQLPPRPTDANRDELATQHRDSLANIKRSSQPSDQDDQSPDFSALAAEFKSTLPGPAALGSMPTHTDLAADPTTTESMPLKKLAQQFQAPVTEPTPAIELPDAPDFSQLASSNLAATTPQQRDPQPFKFPAPVYEEPPVPTQPETDLNTIQTNAQPQPEQSVLVSNDPSTESTTRPPAPIEFRSPQWQTAQLTRKPVTPKNQWQTESPNAQPRPANGNVRSRLPFGLNEGAKNKLASLRRQTNQKITLNTTQFIDHTVRPGETLQSISTIHFGKPDFYLDVYLANRNVLRNPVDLTVGQTLRIPVYDRGN